MKGGHEGKNDQGKNDQYHGLGADNQHRFLVALPQKRVCHKSLPFALKTLLEFR